MKRRERNSEKYATEAELNKLIDEAQWLIDERGARVDFRDKKQLTQYLTALGKLTEYVSINIVVAYDVRRLNEKGIGISKEIKLKLFRRVRQLVREHIRSNWRKWTDSDPELLTLGLMPDTTNNNDKISLQINPEELYFRRMKMLSLFIQFGRALPMIRKNMSFPASEKIFLWPDVLTIQGLNQLKAAQQPGVRIIVSEPGMFQVNGHAIQYGLYYDEKEAQFVLVSFDPALKFDIVLPVNMSQGNYLTKFNKIFADELVYSPSLRTLLWDKNVQSALFGKSNIPRADEMIIPESAGRDEVLEMLRVFQKRIGGKGTVIILPAREFRARGMLRTRRLANYILDKIAELQKKGPVVVRKQIKPRPVMIDQKPYEWRVRSYAFQENGVSRFGGAIFAIGKPEEHLNLVLTEDEFFSIYPYDDRERLQQEIRELTVKVMDVIQGKFVGFDLFEDAGDVSQGKGPALNVLEANEGWSAIPPNIVSHFPHLVKAFIKEEARLRSRSEMRVATGHAARDMRQEKSNVSPVSRLMPHVNEWRGIRRVVKEYRDNILPLRLRELGDSVFRSVAAKLGVPLAFAEVPNEIPQGVKPEKLLSDEETKKNRTFSQLMTKNIQTARRVFDYRREIPDDPAKLDALILYAAYQPKADIHLLFAPHPRFVGQAGPLPEGEGWVKEVDLFAKKLRDYSMSKYHFFPDNLRVTAVPLANQLVAALHQLMKQNDSPAAFISEDAELLRKAGYPKLLRIAGSSDLIRQNATVILAADRLLKDVPVQFLMQPQTAESLDQENVFGELVSELRARMTVA